ncbi:MAG: DNA polymerase ligase N-terminal domain-containing protein [Planctomycetota bacterium]|jgi:hypothetical protein
MPRFVILEHDSPRGRHWDLMLEAAGALATWSLSERPGTAETIDAEALPDHRLAYLDYEGPISGGRGSVARWDRGTYRVERWSAEERIVALRGERLAGRAAVTRSAEDPMRWRFQFVPDPTAR